MSLVFQSRTQIGFFDSVIRANLINFIKDAYFKI